MPNQSQVVPVPYLARAEEALYRDRQESINRAQCPGLCSRCPIWRRELDGALAKRAERVGAGARSADLQEGRLLANKLQTEADTVTEA